MGINDELITTKGNITTYLAQPTGTPKGGIVVIHEVWGLNDHTKNIADRFAAEGYIALAPDLLSDTVNLPEARKMQEDLFNPKTRNEVQPKLRALMTPMHDPAFGELTLTRIRECFNHLFAMEELNERIAVVGFCFGGTYSYTLAVNEPRLKLAVPFYGHNSYGVEDLKRISCPVRAFYGQNDEGLMSALPNLKEEMKAAGVDYEATVYPNCGHAFFNDTNKYSYNQAAATDSWKRTLEYLQKYVAQA